MLSYGFYRARPDALGFVFRLVLAAGVEPAAFRFGGECSFH
jgi:hypothetical protein